MSKRAEFLEQRLTMLEQRRFELEDRLLAAEAREAELALRSPDLNAIDTMMLFSESGTANRLIEKQEAEISHLLSELAELQRE